MCEKQAKTVYKIIFYGMIEKKFVHKGTVAAMQKTFTDKAVHYFSEKGKKHKLCRVPAIIGLKVTLTLYHTWMHFTSGWKRYVCTAFLGLMFVIGSSFSYPVFGGDSAFVSGTEEEAAVIIGESDIELAAEVSVELSELDLLETQELDDYEEDEHQELDAMDKYTLEDILKENGEYRYAEEDMAGQMAEGEFVFDRNDWKLVLINKQHTIPYDYKFTLGIIKDNMQCDERIISDLFAMLQAASDEGIDLVICSPYRDINRQEVLFDRKIKTYMSKGMSYMEAYKVSSQTVTLPGASEHQIGLALDLISNSYYKLDEGFGETETGKWLAEHGCEYGFILRYPKGKEHITGIEYEPWHFRYVGKEAATIITREQITLEEFWDKYL